MADRQEQALKDPMHYSPDLSKPDISGGGTGNFDSAEMGKDLQHVLDP